MICSTPLDTSLDSKNNPAQPPHMDRGWKYRFQPSALSRRCLLVLIFGIVLNVRSIQGASGLFPKMPGGTSVYVVDCQHDEGDAKATASALQGLVNQTSAEAYIIEKERERHVEQLRDCGKLLVMLEPAPGKNTGLRTLFKKYQGSVKKMILYDPKKDWTGFMALMAGAQQHGIPVTEALLNDLKSEFGWTGEVEDFRGRWTNRIEAYDWALAKLMPGCNRQVVFAIWLQAPLVDYAVASKGFAFQLDFETEKAEVQKIFHTLECTAGTSLMGYANTGDMANYVSNPFGIGYVVSDIYANASFWSGFPNKTYAQSLGRTVPVQPGKIYASIMWSDGDNLQFDQNAIWNLWHDPARGTVPVATPLAPSLQELNPPLLDWFYSRMTPNDELVSGATGFQFICVGEFNDELFPAWCGLNRTWCADAGFHAARIWLAPNPSLKYTTYMKTSGLAGVLGEGWSVEAGLPPKIHAVAAINEQDLFNQFMAIQPNPRAPIFLNFTPIVAGIFEDGRGYSAVKRQIDRLGEACPGRYVFLLPKDQFATIRSYYNTNTPLLGARLGAAKGLTPVALGDGNFSIVQREGMKVWQVATNNYFYLDAYDGFLIQPGARLEIDLSYFDSGTGEILLDYDSTDPGAPLAGAYKRHPHVVQRQNTATWKLARFWVSDARFANRENGNTDFRFSNGGDDLLISAVQVNRE
jgi:hypothetical protein